VGYRWRPGTSPTLAQVAVVVADTARVGSSLASALGIVARPPGGAMATPVETRVRAESLYTAMRDAMRRGDWPAFGRAFDALGTALRAAPR
jgi:uncharacterized membrane protein (UPF0182 family)